MLPDSSRRFRRAFTLIELLVVITIIAVLAGIALPVLGSIQLIGKKTQSLSNLRQIGAAFILYCGQNDGQTPYEDDQSGGTTWAACTTVSDNNNKAWYNSLPQLGGFPRVIDYANNHAGFYTKQNPMFVPAASYPADKLTSGTVYFAVSYGSQFNKGVGGAGIAPNDIRLQNFQQPAHTVVFQESGLPGEKANILPASISGNYNGQPKGYASRAIARYTGKTILLFADGHSEALAGSDLVDPVTGNCYWYDPGTVPANPPATGNYGKVYWTMMPDGDPR